MVMRTIQAERLVSQVAIFDPDWQDPDPTSHMWKSWVLPDEDISHLVAEKYLLPAGCQVSYDMIWARWDMRAVHENQPVISDIETSDNLIDQDFIAEAVSCSERSPDWWRNVGAVMVSANGNKIAVACNTHMPNEYDTYIFGDPSLNRDAGQVGKSCAIHAEASVITLCAKHGHALKGSKIYVSTFPCEGCARLIVSSGITEVYFSHGYSSLNAQEVLRANGVRMIHL
ncbi:MAG: deoxycytidylate deaminase, partial [Minisyncoccota bacterium]